MATVAVFISLGGGSYAAVTLARNSVTSGHSRNGQVRQTDIARNAIDSSKVANGKLRRDDGLGAVAFQRRGSTTSCAPAMTVTAIADNATPLFFDSETLDNDGIHGSPNLNRLTAQTPGVYLVQAQALGRRPAGRTAAPRSR